MRDKEFIYDKIDSINIKLNAIEKKIFILENKYKYQIGDFVLYHDKEWMIIQRFIREDWEYVKCYNLFNKNEDITITGILEKKLICKEK
jgi:hypothetical protein